jgi:hypothetical protein
LTAFRLRGVEDYCGIDAAHLDQSMLEIPAERFSTHDLRKPLQLGRTFDLAVSLEVAEHLPADSADAFVESLTRLADIVLFSAAIPHQGGEEHLNEQWPDYWEAKFTARGYQAIDCLRTRLWDSANVDWWYAQNMMFFATGTKVVELQTSAARLPSIPDPLPRLVHPANYMQSLWRQWLLEAAIELAEIIPPGELFLLIDDEKLPSFPCIGGREPVTFPSRGGCYPGLPADDAQAISWLEDARASGPRYLVIAWPSFWWLDFYHEFQNHLDRAATRLARTNRVAVYRFLDS